MKKLLLAFILLLLVSSVAWACAGDPLGCFITPCPVPLQGYSIGTGCYVSPCPLASHSL